MRMAHAGRRIWTTNMSGPAFLIISQELLGHFQKLAHHWKALEKSFAVHYLDFGFKLLFDVKIATNCT